MLRPGQQQDLWPAVQGAAVRGICSLCRRLTLNRIQNPEGFRLPSLGCDMVFPLLWSCGSGRSMMAAGTGTSEAEQAGGSTGLLMDLAANEKAVHADFFNDFEDLFDDDDIQ
ncbi:COP9 signalosome complex subunit 9 isoform X1 [Symphalangus syndactylus]|uniref:COP9 signalosome complex subunit 9 isoform X1 n=1 Tax=Symphalangus syndactylus TaxID=9590 RepID=UPI0030048803